MALPTKAASSGVKEMFRRWLFKSSAYNQLGLYTHDCLRETEDVAEAVRRLPDDVYDARTFRIIRALQYDMMKRILPKDQWTSIDDKDNLYLQPYLEEIWKEEAEKKAWAKK